MLSRGIYPGRISLLVSLCPHDRRDHVGRARSKLREQDMKSVRGTKIGMIFQGPMTSLNPALTIGEQLCEVLLRRRSMGMAAARAEAVRMLERVRIPSAQSRLKEYLADILAHIHDHKINWLDDPLP